MVEYSTRNPNIAGSNPASDTGREKIAEKKLCSFLIFGVCSVEHIMFIFSMTLVNCQHQRKMSNIIWTLQIFLSLFNLFCLGTLAAADSSVSFILPQLLSGRIFDSKS